MAHVDRAGQTRAQALVRRTTASGVRKTMKRLLGIAVLAFGASLALMGQTFTITTIAGSLPPVPTAPNNLFLQSPDAVFVDPSGNVFIADTNGNRVWKVDPKGGLTLVAGTGVSGSGGDGKA